MVVHSSSGTLYQNATCHFYLRRHLFVNTCRLNLFENRFQSFFSQFAFVKYKSFQEPETLVSKNDDESEFRQKFYL